MTLPAAPGSYTLRDQDRIRKILEMGVNDFLRRLSALESIVTPPPVGGTGLRMALANGNVWAGPGIGGFDTTGPIFGAAGYDFGWQPDEIVAAIALADEHDVQLIVGPSGGRGQYIDAGGFSRTLYEQRTRRFEGIPEFADAVDRQRVWLILGDEFNHPNFDVGGVGTCHPDDVNWMGNLHKSIWPGAHTFVRMGRSTLVDGWNGSGAIPNGFWTGLDYGWAQRAGQHNNDTLQVYYDNEKADLLSVDLGLIPGFNLWNGGIKVNSEGVDACWDVNNDGGSMMGYIIGSVSEPGGDRVACGTIDTGTGAQPRVVSSPDWIKRYADIVTGDFDAPFSVMWANPGDCAASPLGADCEWADELIHRSDFVDALDYAITTAAGRTQYNGIRPAKPGEPI